MILVTILGTYEITGVEDPVVTVRAHSSAEIVRLRQFGCPELSEPSYHGTGDWRALLLRSAWSRLADRLLGLVGYEDLSEAATRQLGGNDAKIYRKTWTQLGKLPPGPEEPGYVHPTFLPWANLAASGKKLSYGGVVLSPDGRFLLREPVKHYDGYAWTFAKGPGELGEPARDTALRHVLSEMSAPARILLALPGEFKGGTTVNRYFLMTVDPERVDLNFTNEDTQGLRWAFADEARTLIGQTTNATGRKRDLAVLEHALVYVPAPQPLQREISRSENWRIRPMVADRTQHSFMRAFAPEEMAHLIRGLIPNCMEDRWFSWFEEGVLHLHRSWTGLEFFRLQFAFHDDKWIARSFEVPTTRDGVIDGMNDQRLLNGVLDLMLNFGEEPTIDGMVWAIMHGTQEQEGANE